MAGFLAMDWNAHGLRVVEGHLKGQHLHLGGGLGLPVPFDPAQAETLGAHLKAQLQAAGIKPAPVVVTVSREMLLGRDVHHPDVPENEVPAIVQFQIFKELAVSPDDLVLDHQPLSLPWPTGEKRALALLLRRPHLAAYERLCQAAGLKLAAVIPHAVGMLVQLQPLNLTGVVAYLAGSELIVARGPELLYSRFLEQDADWVLSLRQALGAYRVAYPQQPVAMLLLAGSQIPVELDELADKQHLALQLVDPFQNVRAMQPLPPEFDFLHAVGALEAVTRLKKLPINFAAPKRTLPKPNRSRLYTMIGGAVAAFLLLTVGGWYWLESSDRSQKIDELTKSLAGLKEEINGYGNTQEKYAALLAWKQAEVVILDEIYDLSARFPDLAGIRFTRAVWETLAPSTTPVRAGAAAAATKPSGTGAAKKVEQPIAQVSLEITAESAELLPKLRQALDAEKHWQIDRWERDPNNPRQVQAVLKVYPLEPREFQARLELGVNRTQPGEIRTDQRLRPTVRPRTPGGRP